MDINMLNLFLFLGLLSKSTESASISGISTLQGITNVTYLTGSYMGGTSLYFHAPDFTPDVFLYYSISIGSQTCPIVPFTSGGSTIECIVPALPSTSLFPTKASIEITSSYPGEIITIAANTTFYYLYEATPWILYINPTEACPGDEIAFVGRWETTDETLIVEAKIKQQQLNILDPSPSLDYWGWYNVSAVINDNIHGDTTPNILLSSGLGNSAQVWIGTQYSSQGTPFDFRTLARIDSISNNQGSSAGGLSITITGAGFPGNTSLYSIQADGIDCSVQSASYTTLVCQTNSNPNPSSNLVYAGNAGLVREYWRNTTGLSFSQLIDIVEPYSTTYIATPQIKLNEDISIKDRMYGLFIPPVSGDYYFYVSSNSSAQVYLSTDNTRGNMKEIIDFESSTELKGSLIYNTSNSSAQALEANNAYYIEAWHMQGLGPSHFELGVQMPNPDPSNPNITNFMPFVQNVCVAPTKLVREQQVLQIGGSSKPTGGTLALKYGGTSLIDIAWNANNHNWDCSNVVTQLNSLGLGGFLCSFTSDSSHFYYTITFDFPLTSTRKLISVDTSKILPAGLSSKNTKTSGTVALSGSFRVFNGAQASPIIRFNDTIRSTESNLNTYMSNLNSKLVLQGYYNGDAINFYFLLPASMISSSSAFDFTIDTSGILGGQLETDTRTFDYTNTNSIIYQPGTTIYYPVIPSDFLRNYETTPQLTVDIGGTRAVCRGNCSFVYLTPPYYSEITAIAADATTVTITGSLIDTTPGNTEVYIGFVSCVITSISPSEIVAELPLGGTSSTGSPNPIGVAGTYTPIVYIANQGFVVSSATSTTVSIPIAIDTITPSLGSTEGGTILTITGTGFLDSLDNTDIAQSVNIGGSDCAVLTTSVTQLTCITSAQTGSSTLEVTVNAAVGSSTAFAYDIGSTPQVTGVSVDFASTITVTPLVIIGSGFGTSSGAVTVVLYSAVLGEYPCMVTRVVDGEIDCNIHGGPNGGYSLVITARPNGYAQFSSVSNSFSLIFEVTKISPATGSTLGGTLITVTGNGFSLNPLNMLAFIDTTDNLCAIQSITNSSSLTCLTPPKGIKSADTAYELTLFGRLVDEATCTGSCNFQYATAATPSVSAVSALSGQAGDNLVITGTNFGSSNDLVHVFFGDAEADTVLISDTSINVIVPSCKSVSVPITMSIDGMGIAFCAFDFTNAVVVTSVSPMQVSQGGAIIEITGSGFDPGMVFAFGSTACKVFEITDTTVSCQLKSYFTSETPQLLVVTGSGPFTCTDDAVCAVTFTASKTFSISSHSGNLAITGSNFPSITDLTLVTVSLIGTSATYYCDVTSITTTTLDCTPNAPAGTYNISVYIQDIGFGAETLSYTLALYVATITAPSSSYSGGLVLALDGTGLYQSTAVEVCGFPCKVSLSSGSSLQCKLPPVPTTYSLSEFAVVTVPTQFITSGSSSTKNAFDGNLTSYYQVGYNSSLKLSVDVGSDYLLNLSKMQFLGGGLNEGQYMILAGIALQGSNDSTTWYNLNNFTYVNNYWNTWTVPPTQTPPIIYRYYQLYLPPVISYSYKINEFQLFGIRFLDNSSINITCPVTVASNSTATPVATPSTQIDYQGPLTAYITGLSPSRGTSAGGDTLTLTGSGFGTDTSAVTVTIDGVNCRVTGVSNTQITCLTGARLDYVVPSLEVFIAGGGDVSTEGLLFLYSELWSDPHTWGGEVPPIDGQLVVIPQGMTVVLDIATNLLAGILIQGNFIVQDVANITIDAYYIFVYGGLLQIGTEDAPFTNDITITIHGNSHSPAIPNYGNKFIAVRDGVLDIHGKAKTPSWSMLEHTAYPGNTTITLQDSVNWCINDNVVIATTSYGMNESEVMTISAVNGAQITFTEPLQYQHYAATETYGDYTIDMRAEVGLLSRNIKIRGTIDPTDPMHGVHIMLFSPGDESSIGRIENLELFNAGQAYNLGRYPLHFHLIGTVTKSYIKNNAIHDTYNRATTVHGVYYLTVSHNVAYNTMGHTYFIEDGIERQNTFDHNLGVNTHASFSLLPLDQTPATFWITHPTNYVLNNHAAGSDAYGFWYSMPANPTGPSATPNIYPEYNPLGLFQDNTAHSVGTYGLRIFHRFLPSLFSAPPISNNHRADWWNVTNTPVPACLERFTAWKCQGDGAIGEDLGDVQFIDFKLADNILVGIELTYTDWTELYATTRIVNALIIGNSGNSEGACNGTIGVLGPQTDGLLIDGVHFFNFRDGQFPLGDESHSPFPATRDTGARLTKLQGLTFTNSNRLIKWNVPRTGIFEILDDSLTGTAGVFVAAYWDHLLTPECHEDLATYNSIVCGAGAKIRRVAFYGQSPGFQFSFINATVIRVSGDSIPQTTVTNADGSTSSTPRWTSISMQKGGKNKSPTLAWNIPFVTGYKYSVHWSTTPVDWLTLNIEQNQFTSTEYVHLSLNFTDHRENFTATRGTLPAGTVTTAANFVDPRILLYKNSPLLPTDPSGTYTWNNDTTKTFEIMINGKSSNADQWGAISIVAYRCYGTHCSGVSVLNDTSGPVTEMYWSNSSIWPSGALPKAGSYVEVPSSWHLYLDIDTPLLHQIDVNGVLEFAPNVSASLNANWVFVRAGSIVSGSASNPTLKNVTHSIVLQGDSEADSFAFSPYIEAGNKVLVVTGNLSMYGYPKNTTSYLEQNAYPLDTVIFVTGVDWEVGDTIAISPSGFRVSEHETFNITSINGTIADYDQVIAGISVQSIDFSNDADWINSNFFRQTGRNKKTVDFNQQAEAALSVGITKITLSAPIAYFHSGVKVNMNGYVADLRTEVALLSRNVKITTEGNGWQSTTVVNDFLDDLVVGAPVLRPGFVNLNNVEFDGCGQPDTSLACLRFESSGTNSSTVLNCAINNPGTWGLYMNSARNIDYSNNVIFNGVWRGIVAMNITNVIFDNNMIIRIITRGFSNVAFNAIIDATAGFHICSDHTVDCTFSITRNKVFGSDFAGYIMSSAECGNPNKVNKNNKVRSANKGFLMTNSGDFNCTEVIGNIIHFTLEGLGFKGNSPQVRVSNIELIENIVGMSMRTGRDFDGVAADHILSDSIFIGSTIYSHCDICYTDLDCIPRFGYTFGTTDTGVATITLTSEIKLPMFKQTEESNILGSQQVTNIAFMSFNEDPHCLFESFAIVSNSMSPDYQLPQFMSKVEFINVGSENRIYMFNPDPLWLNAGDCVNWNCTGPLNALLVDLDGSVTNYPTGGYVLSNNPGIASKSQCILDPVMNAYFCSNDTSDPNYYMILQFQSMDIDNKTRIFSPMNVTSYQSNFTSQLGGGFRDDLANFQDHSWDGFYTGHIRWSVFPGVVFSGQHYNISAAGTLPNSFLFQLQATRGKNQPIIVSIFYLDPTMVQILVNGTLFEPIPWINGTQADCTFNDVHGTNKWNSQDNTLQFVLRSEVPVLLQKTSSVMINMKINIQLSDFFANNKSVSFLNTFAAMLKIPPYRISIVNVKVGSVILDMHITANASLGVPGTTTTSSQLNELEELLQQLNVIYEAGALDSTLGVTIMNFNAAINLVTEVSSPGANPGNTGGNTNGNNGGNTGGSNGGDGGDGTISPSGDNQGGSKSPPNAFEIVAEDWIMAVFVGALFLVIIISGLILYKRNATVHLHEISPSKISGIGENSFDIPAGKTAWVPEERKAPQDYLVSRVSFIEEKKVKEVPPQ